MTGQATAVCVQCAAPTQYVDAQSGTFQCFACVQLAVKRGAATLREEAPLLLKQTGMPAEILITLLYWAYRGALHSRTEMDELLAFRSLSEEYRDVIVPGVLGRIRFLSQSIQAGITNWQTISLSDFDALRSLTLDAERHYDMTVLGGLPLLERLTVSGRTGQTFRESRLWRELTQPATTLSHLTVLTLEQVAVHHIPDSDFGIEALKLVDCVIERLSEFVARMPRLRALTIVHMIRLRFDHAIELDLRPLVRLVELDLYEAHNVEPLGLDALAPTLRCLSASTRMEEKQILPLLEIVNLELNVGQNFSLLLARTLTKLQCLYTRTQLVFPLAALFAPDEREPVSAIHTLGLARLSLDALLADSTHYYPRITHLSLLDVEATLELARVFPNLTHLRVEGCAFGVGVFRALSRLQTLDIAHTELASPMTDLQALRDLRVLKIYHCHGLSGYGIQTLRRLRVLDCGGAPFVGLGFLLAGGSDKSPTLDYFVPPVTGWSDEQTTLLRQRGTTVLEAAFDAAAEEWSLPGMEPQFSDYFVSDRRF